MTTGTAIPAPRLIDVDGLGSLYRVLVAEGYHVAGVDYPAGQRFVDPTPPRPTTASMR